MSNRVGRPTDCTPEVTGRVCEGIAQGLSIRAACSIADIHETSYFDWMRRGAEGEEPFAKFLHAVKKARTVCEVDLVAIIRDAAPKDWRAAGWMLERRFADDYGRRTEVTGANGGAVKIEAAITVEAIGAETDEAALRALAEGA